MSVKEQIYQIVDGLTDEQLKGLLTMLTGYNEMLAAAQDDAYCTKLYQEYAQDSTEDRADNIPLEDFASELGIQPGMLSQRMITQ